MMKMDAFAPVQMMMSDTPVDHTGLPGCSTLKDFAEKQENNYVY